MKEQRMMFIKQIVSINSYAERIKKTGLRGFLLDLSGCPPQYRASLPCPKDFDLIKMVFGLTESQWSKA
ncbi:MAG: hypothetical protein HYR56_07900 [Acidobacteria bacterium]|nr:hypothetical protein [Acidobacteriota bacterium]MBI3426160.1 hypothetical protein [Acidobacteriota bacterium]